MLTVESYAIDVSLVALLGVIISPSLHTQSCIGAQRPVYPKVQSTEIVSPSTVSPKSLDTDDSAHVASLDATIHNRKRNDLSLPKCNLKVSAYTFPPTYSVNVLRLARQHKTVSEIKSVT